MTLREASDLAKSYGCTLTRRYVTGEYRVNFIRGTEATAYYTDDIEDAVATAKAMSKEVTR